MADQLSSHRAHLQNYSQQMQDAKDNRFISANDRQSSIDVQNVDVLRRREWSRMGQWSRICCRPRRTWAYVSCFCSAVFTFLAAITSLVLICPFVVQIIHEGRYKSNETVKNSMLPDSVSVSPALGLPEQVRASPPSRSFAHIPTVDSNLLVPNSSQELHSTPFDRKLFSNVLPTAASPDADSYMYMSLWPLNEMAPYRFRRFDLNGVQVRDLDFPTVQEQTTDTLHFHLKPSLSASKVKRGAHSQLPSTLQKRCGSVAEVCISLTDVSQYRVMTLNNSLRVLLVSNSEASAATAALDVTSGFFNEGDVLGMAHFCEHLLFLGTEKYPIEGEYSAFLSSHGGYDNAYTSSENTNFYFSVSNAHLEEALDRLAQFFIAPLLKTSGAEREKNAVNSEYQKNKGIPAFVNYEMLKAIARNDSAFSRFSVGSLETFNVSHLVEKLRAYYQAYYSSNVMQLVIYGNQDLDKLQHWAEQYFGQIQNKMLSRLPPALPPFSDGYSGKIAVYKPLGTSPFINIVWQTESLQSKYRKHMTRFLGVLFGFRGKGSLDSILGSRSWSSSCQYSVSSYGSFALHTISIALTDIGEKHLVDVVSTVFGYVNFLQNCSYSVLQSVWKWLIYLEQMRFDYADPPGNIPQYASSLASMMRTTEDPIDFLSPPERYQFDPDLLKDILHQFTPTNTNILYGKPSVLLSPREAPTSTIGPCVPMASHIGRFDIQNVDLVEDYGSTPYGVYCTAAGISNQWKNAPVPQEASLPDLSIYAPTYSNMFIIPPSSPFTGVPEKILDNKNGYSVWWMQDVRFRNPVQIVTCEAESPIPGESPLARALVSVYLRYLSFVLSEQIYLGHVAGYGLTFGLSYRGVHLEFAGLSDNLVMSKFMTGILKSLVDISPSAFSANGVFLRMAVLQAVQAFREYGTTQLPYNYVRDLMGSILLKSSFYYTEILAELENLVVNGDTLNQQLSSFVKGLYSSISSLTCYSTGNVDKKQSLAFASMINSKLMMYQRKKAMKVARPLRPSEVGKVPPGVTAFAVPVLNPLNDPNSAILITYQIGPVCQVAEDPRNGSPVTCTEHSLINSVYTILLHLLIKSACYDQLRTKEQLGYTVGCGAGTVNEDISIIYFLIQSSVQPPPYLLNRTWEFVQAFRKSMVADAVDFTQAVQTYTAILLSRDTTLRSQTDRVWSQIATKLFRFQYKLELLEVMKNVTYEGFLAFFDDFILPGEETRFNGMQNGTEILNNVPGLRELVIGAFHTLNTSDVHFYSDQFPPQRQFSISDLHRFKNSTELWSH